MKKANIIENIIMTQMCQKVRSRYESLNLNADRSDYRSTPSSLTTADLTEDPIDSTDRRNFMLFLALKEPVDLIDVELLTRSSFIGLNDPCVRCIGDYKGDLLSIMPLGKSGSELRCFSFYG